jgi:mRNA-degrading endonuclease YafQ of YafQ-DinJ toxin-antitoxin module
VRTFSRTSQFKKDVKLADRRGKNLAKLKVVIDLLIDGEVLPPQYKESSAAWKFCRQPRLSCRAGLGFDLHVDGK